MATARGRRWKSIRIGLKRTCKIVRKFLLLLPASLLLSGCAWTVRQETDQLVCDLVNHPFDVAPEHSTEARRASPETLKAPRPSSTTAPAPKSARDNEVSTDAKASAWMEPPTESPRSGLPLKDGYLRTVSWTQPPPDQSTPGRTKGTGQPTYQLQIPPQLPGSEAPRIEISREPRVAAQEIERNFPDLPPLPAEPRVHQGPGGKPYTLADFQRMAAANNPALRQAASDVEAAKGNLIQAKTYPNPITSYLVDPSNNNSTAGVQGGAIDQPIITGGKQKLGVAAAQKDLDNAILALKRARNDLATAVRNAYFTLLVDVETLVVTRAQSQFADDIYRLQTGLLKGAQAAPYEPTALRAQAFTNRLAYKQAIASYIYDWKSLVATIGLPQLPLSEVAGRVDRFIPYYDFDEVRAYVLRNHTDVLTARNGIKKAQFLLKVAQVTPIFPNLDVRYALEKDFSLGPFGTYQTLALGFPLPIWDQNKGNIIAAQAALIRASEESHRVEVTLTSNLAAAYANYRNNLYALEYFRRYILPDLVRYYRGVFARRQIDPSSAFGDLVFAQQNLSSNVTTYLGILGSLWSSVVSVADFLQTDDLFQLARKHELSELPDFSQPPPWACDHADLAARCASSAVKGAPPVLAPAAGVFPFPLTRSAPAEPGRTETSQPPPPAGAAEVPPDRPPDVQPPPARQAAAPASGSNPDTAPWLERPRASGGDRKDWSRLPVAADADNAHQALPIPVAQVKAHAEEEDHHASQDF
jgi:cobalt-zinc-cadmium efflux system outer membrane protein